MARIVIAAYFSFLLLLSYTVEEGSACNGCSIDESKFKVYSCSETTDELYHWPEKKNSRLTENCELTTYGHHYFKIDVESFEFSVKGTMNDMVIDYETKDGCKTLEGDNKNEQLLQYLQYYHIGDMKCPFKGNVDPEDKVQILHKSHQLSLAKWAGFSNVTFSFTNINGDKDKNVCYVIENQMNCNKKRHKSG